MEPGTSFTNQGPRPVRIRLEGPRGGEGIDMRRRRREGKEARGKRVSGTRERTRPDRQGLGRNLTPIGTYSTILTD